MAVFEVLLDGDGRVVQVVERPSAGFVETLKEVKSLADIVKFVRTSGPQGFMANDALTLGLIEDIQSNPKLSRDDKNRLILALTSRTALDGLTLKRDPAIANEDNLFGNKLIALSVMKGSYALIDYFIDP